MNMRNYTFKQLQNEYNYLSESLIYLEQSRNFIGVSNLTKFKILVEYQAKFAELYIILNLLFVNELTNLEKTTTDLRRNIEVFQQDLNYKIKELERVLKC